jgi:hypothetical protein
MASVAVRALRLLELLGFDMRRLWLVLKRMPLFVRQCRQYRSLSGSGALPLRFRDLQPILWEAGEPGGQATGHYFWQDLWAARKIFARRPSFHVDVGSRVDGFVAHLLTFMPVRYVDIRPLCNPVDGLEVVRGDLTNLSVLAGQVVESLSCLHVVEHVGLGRYGDHLDPDGWRAAIENLKGLLTPGGVLYISVPIGRERLRFNAHRIFDAARIALALQPLELLSFSVVDDEGRLHENTTIEAASDLQFGCGLFEARAPR